MSGSRAQAPPRQELLETLVTLRDWLRWGASSFGAAELSYGHGTGTALDEAAFLILHTLDLPIDTLDPFLDARLIRAERERVLDILERRIATRKPAPYLTNAAWIGGHRFYVDERVLVPRSFIGELVTGSGLDDLLAADAEVHRILDLCTGSGCLAILAALAYPEALVDAVDISADALAVARRNVADYGLEERVRLCEGDLFAPVAGQRYDLILSNPPYVDAAAMAALPPEYRAEPALALAAGDDGLDVIRRILAEAGRHLMPQGGLLLEVGRGKNLIERDFPDLPAIWIDTVESRGEVLWLAAGDLPADATGSQPSAGRRTRRR